MGSCEAEHRALAGHLAVEVEPRVASLVEEAADARPTEAEAAETCPSPEEAEAAAEAQLPAGAVGEAEAAVALRPLRLEAAAVALAHASCSPQEAEVAGSFVPSTAVAAVAPKAATAQASATVSLPGARPARPTQQAARTREEAASHRLTTRLYLSHAAWRTASSPR